MGTHGNLEWLPGEERRTDEESYPDIALGDLPNVYPYHMTITGEGMIAKRRPPAALSATCRLLQPMPAPSDEIEELEKTLDEYAHQKETGNGAEDMKPTLLGLVKKAKLDQDLPYKEGDDFDAYLSMYITISKS